MWLSDFQVFEQEPDTYNQFTANTVIYTLKGDVWLKTTNTTVCFLFTWQIMVHEQIFS